eukprot:6302365-Pyramimonas_sp.AAC.1
MTAQCAQSTVGSLRPAMQWPVRCCSWLSRQLTARCYGPGFWPLIRPGFFRARAWRSVWCGPFGRPICFSMCMCLEMAR